MAELKPSVNPFAFLESNDPGDTRLADLGAAAKADEVHASARDPKNINKKQVPQVSVWKANKINCTKNKQQQPAASKAKVNAAKNKQQQPVASKANKVNTAASAANTKTQQQPAAPANLTGELLGRAYPSARALIYKNRKPNDVAGGAPGDNKKGDQPKGAAVNNAPAPIQEEPPAAMKPVLPPPTLHDLAQFPSLK